MATIVAAESLAHAIFGEGDISDKIKAFDFSSISVKDNTKDDYLHIGLAPSYGKLTSEAIKSMDEELKIAIASSMKYLEKLPPAERSWDAVKSVMMNNPCLEPMDKDEIARSDKLIKTSSGDFRIDGSPNELIVKEVQSWFTALINDEDVLKSTEIDIDVLARIVAQTGATVDSFLTFFAKHEFHEKTLVDIGVLRFPDVDNPHFKVYRIQLTAWSDSRRIISHQDDYNGITGEYNCRKFKPRDATIKQMKEESRKKAVAEANSLFG